MLPELFVELKHELTLACMTHCEPMSLGDPEACILASWERNAGPWIGAVREQRIESRRHVTDQAIIKAVLSRNPASVLDIGCGEGWLVRALAAKGTHATGVDVIPELIESARAGGGDFALQSYDDLITGSKDFAPDVAVCNFALFGQQSVERLFAGITGLLRPAGTFIVQTLHPLVACGELPYREGWRDGNWAGVPGAFADPAPWYFRTLAGWVNLFERHSLRLQELQEPVYPAGGRPASVIFIARAGT